MKKYLLFFTIIFISFFGFSQTYNKVISSSVGGNYLNTRSSISLMGEKELIYGNMMFGGGFMLKIDTNGDTLWSKQFTTGQLFSATEMTDSSFVIVSSGGVTDFELVRLSKNGAIISNRGYQNNSLISLSAPKVVRSGNSEVALISGTNEDSLYFIRFNSSLNITTSKIIKIPIIKDFSLNIYTRVLEVIELSNGDLFCVITSNADVNDYLIFMRINPISGVVWTKLMQMNSGAFGTISPKKAIQMSSSNLMISGSGLINGIQGAFFLELDPNGNFINGVLVEDGSTSAIVDELTNGNLALLSGPTNNSVDGQLKNSIYQLNSAGNMIWGRIIGYNNAYQVYNIHETSNGDILAVSEIIIGGSNGIVMSRLDNNGNTIGCLDVVSSINTSNWSTVLTNTTAQEFTTTLTPSITSAAISHPPLSIINIGLTSSSIITQPLCNGDLAQVNYNITGGASPYTYTWSNGTNSQNLVNAPAGIHNVRVVDGNGCVQLDTFSIIEPPSLSASFQKTDVTCFSSFDGTVNLTVGGGTPGYSFFWANGVQTEDISNLGGGFYQVTITDTNGCQLTQGISVAEPGPLTASIVGFQDVSCFGLCDGILTGNAAGGTAPYAYLWNDSFLQSTSAADSLCTGNYFLTLTDANGCNAYTSAYVGQPTQLQNSITTTNANCGIGNGGAVVSSMGGVQPYTYIWSNGNSGNSNTNLDAGYYYIIGYDANGCGDSAIFQIGVDVYSVAICEITVDSTSTQNKVIWEKPIASNIAGFNIYRDVVGLYQLIDFVPYDSLSEYTDASNGIDPGTTSYRYKISTVDTCGNEGTRSAYHETIHLTSNLGLNSEVNLIWDGYKGFQVGYYRIIVDSTNNSIQDYYVKDSVSYTNFTWTDNNPPTGDYLVYAIEVVTPSTCSVTKSIDHNTTRSNRATVTSPNALAIEEAVLQQAKVYPNPSVGQLTIDVNASNWSYQIMDMGGKQVKNGVSQSFKTLLDVSFLEKGIYMIKIEIGASSIFKKIIKL